MSAPRSNRSVVVIGVIVVIVVAALAGGVYLSGFARTSGSSSSSTTAPLSTSGVVQVVAAENFWGSLASQLGGSHAHVISIVSDPNADPHEYEANPRNATAIAEAQFIIQNGAGYDDWMTQLVSANNNPNQTVLNVADLLGATSNNIGTSETGTFSNEHFWYNPHFVNATVRAMYDDYVKIDPNDKSYFTSQYASLNSSLHSYMALEASIRARFGDAKVASTETIFLYMANATGLNVVSPFQFMKAVAEGNDPAAQDVANFQTLLSTPGSVKVLVYNNQTVSPVTDDLKAEAAQNHIPVVPVTETMQPITTNFQTWMTTELTNLQTALQKSQSTTST